VRIAHRLLRAGQLECWPLLVGVNYRDPAASIILAGRGVVNG
jgi:hypothetical protein